MQAANLAAAYLLDWLIGDPEGWPHPVRAIGACVTAAERIMRHPKDSARYELTAGAALAFGIPIATAYIAFEELNYTAKRRGVFSVTMEIILAASCLATRNLLDEADRVILELESGNLAAARVRLSRIVGRDTEMLDESEISRAVIETLGESLSDGIIAPLFYLAIGGVPAALAYKSINTMDSMIGHRDERYFYFGKTAARLDDVANFLPSRISALLICVAAALLTDADGKTVWRTWLREGNKHKSPNAGQPESAMAGALHVRLGGKNVYDGETIQSPLIGKEFFPPAIQQARTAVKITAVASILGCTAALFYLWRKNQ